MKNISIHSIIITGTICLFIGMFLGKKSLVDNIEVLQEVKKECWTRFEDSAKGNTDTKTAFAEFEHWIKFKIEENKAIQKASYYYSQQQY